MSIGDAEALQRTDRAQRESAVTPQPNWTRLWFRAAVPAVAFGTLIVFEFLFWIHSAIAFDALRLWGIHPPVTNPFLDLRYIFAGVECWAKGVNVYIFNPCDPLGRPHGYSPLWLRFTFLPSQDWTPLAGMLVDGLFAVSLATFPPPQNRGELMVMLAAVLSPTVVFALHRANVDVIIFLLLLAAAGLWVRKPAQRFVGYGIMMFAGLLKFYPLIVLGLAVRERFRFCATVFIVGGFALMAFVAFFHTELVEMGRNIPAGSYFVGDMFGAKNLPDGVATEYLGTEATWLGVALWGTLLALFVACAFTTFSRLVPHHTVARLAPLESALLLIGGAVICGCFFAGQSVGYRGIFLLFTLPGLVGLCRVGRVRHLAAWSCALVLFLMWQGIVTWNPAFLEVLRLRLSPPIGTTLWLALWAARELAWWLLVGVLAGIILAYISESPVASNLKHLATRRTIAESS